MKTVLITGSSRGIGLDIAKRFSMEKYNVVLNCNKSVNKMETEVELLKKTNENVIGIQCDVSKYEDVERMFNKIESIFGNVDILINNAGICHIGLFTEMSEQEWGLLINSNINSVFNCTQLALKSMISRKSGVIVNISSIWGVTGASCECVYSATKGAINSFTKAIAKEVAPSDIRVNAIACGLIDTEMNNFLTEEEKNNIIESIPLCRIGKGKEISDMAFFLSSEQSSYLTGQVITVDGGFS